AVDTIGNDLTVSDATHALVLGQDIAGLGAEVDAAMPQAIGADWVKTILGGGQCFVVGPGVVDLGGLGVLGVRVALLLEGVGPSFDGFGCLGAFVCHH